MSLEAFAKHLTLHSNWAEYKILEYIKNEAREGTYHSVVEWIEYHNESHSNRGSAGPLRYKNYYHQHPEWLHHHQT